MEWFENAPDRVGTQSVKWDLSKVIFGSEEVLPMWVADMDFSTPAEVVNALVERARHGIFGYTITDQKMNTAVTGWLKKRHNWEIRQPWIVYSHGVVTTLHMAVQALTEETDKLLIQTPVYPPFYDLAKKHDRELLTNPLKLENGRYEIDFDDFEQQLKKGVKAFVLCNPHNPVGRVWTKEELSKMAELCLQYGTLIFSDEIHADLMFKPAVHIPIGSLSKEISKQTITCMSPTKTFNLAGLQASFAVIEDEAKRKKVQQMFEKQGIHMLNTMGIVAMEASFSKGEAWLEGLLAVLEQHKDYVLEAFRDREEIDVIEPEGTYLLWLDCRKLGMNNEELKKFFKQEAKVGLNDGLSFGEEGEGFMRMNIGCPHITLEQGVTRILDALNKRKVTQ